MIMSLLSCISVAIMVLKFNYVNPLSLLVKIIENNRKNYL